MRSVLCYCSGGGAEARERASSAVGSGRERACDIDSMTEVFSGFPAEDEHPCGRDPQLASAARCLLRNSLAPASWRAYSGGEASYRRLCGRYGLRPVLAKADTLVYYLADLRRDGVAYGTARQRLAAVRHLHIRSGLDFAAAAGDRPKHQPKHETEDNVQEARDSDLRRQRPFTGVHCRHRPRRRARGPRRGRHLPRRTTVHGTCHNRQTSHRTTTGLDRRRGPRPLSCTGSSQYRSTRGSTSRRRPPGPARCITRRQQPPPVR